MTQAQWDEHASHMESDISWPASKEDILAACNGEDVSSEVLGELKTDLPEGTYKSPNEVKSVLVH